MAGLLLVALTPSPAQTPDPSDTTYVRFNTNLGNIDVQMLTAEAPNTVNNFFSYVNSGAYTNSLIHRSTDDADAGVAVIQGGGYTLVASPLAINAITQNAPIASEAGFPNIRGTLAMALTTGPDTGTSEWYFNVADDSAALDSSANYGPFTVFGVIANSSSLAVMDAINNLPVLPLDTPFGELPDFPLYNYISGNDLVAANFVVISSITTLTVTDFTTWQDAFQNDPNAAMDELPAATPQKDSTPNLLKYLCDVPGDATMSAASRAKLPTVTQATVSGTTYLTLTWHQRPNLVGVYATVETSTDLQTWAAPTNAATTQTTATDGSNDVIMQVQVPALTSGTQFIRLSLTQ